MSSRSSDTVEPEEVQEESLQGGTKKPSPAEHVASPSSPSASIDSSGRPSFQSHGRTMSVATDTTTAPRTNRFSITFPIQPAGSASPSRTQSPTREAYTPLAEPPSTLTGPMDTNFLTAIAAQERRVLELKEELSRAEADLTKLKRQWGQHEAQKKRNDAKSLTKLQPLQTSMPTGSAEEDSDGSSAWMQQEMERRKALLNGNRSSSRTVFSGSKHTRTLSLLSPASRSQATFASQQRFSRPPRKDSLSESARQSQHVQASLPKAGRVSRAATTPDLTVDGTRVAGQMDQLPEADVDGDMFLQTGKKMATGLRDGLWTFWEDLRQATVGDEATQIPPPPRRQSSTQTLRTAKTQSSRNSLRPSSPGSSTSKASTDTKRPSPARKPTKSSTMSLSSTPALADPSFWADHNIPPNPVAVKKRTASPNHAKTPSKATSVESTDNEAWDVWDESSPQFSRSSSAASDPTTVSSPRMSTETANTLDFSPATGDPTDTIRVPRSKDLRASEGSSSGKKDPIPWPALKDLGPSKALRRTASHLMSEWERSLTPSPGKEDAGQPLQGDYLGLGAEAAAVNVAVERKRD